jgi:hypothetical protein
VTDGYTSEEIEIGKRALLQERQIERSDDGALASSLVTQAYVGRTWGLRGEDRRRDRRADPRSGERHAAQVREAGRYRVRVCGRFCQEVGIGVTCRLGTAKRFVAGVRGYVLIRSGGVTCGRD